MSQTRNAPGRWTPPSRSFALPPSIHICLVEFTTPCQSPTQAALSSCIPGSSLPPLPADNPCTEIQAAQIYLPSCVSRGISTSQAPVQILYRKFPLSSKNSRPLCTTLLLKFCSPGSPAFNSSSCFSPGNPSLSVPLVASPSLVEYFCSSL